MDSMPSPYITRNPPTDDTRLASCSKENSDCFKAEKALISEHPLFPLVQHLLTKCDLATTSFATGIRLNFQELENSVILRNTNFESFLSGNQEIDSFLISVVRNLCHQFNELQKVEELCEDFLYRYSARIKSHFCQQFAPICMRFTDEIGCDSPPHYPDTSPPTVLTNQGSTRPPVAMLRTADAVFSIPLSHDTQFIDGLSIENFTANTKHQFYDAKDKDFSAHEEISTHCAENKLRRVNLPKKAVESLRLWLFHNMEKPYPSDEEKQHLLIETGLSLAQINNWFINARRRILYPLMDPNPVALTCGTQRSNLPDIAEAPAKQVGSIDCVSDTHDGNTVGCETIISILSSGCGLCGTDKSVKSCGFHGTSLSVGTSGTTLKNAPLFDDRSDVLSLVGDGSISALKNREI